jgi:hypothetical protein
MFSLTEKQQSVAHAILLAAAVSTYVFSPDDIVWRFVRNSSHPRAWEHAAFATAAALLGIALLLKINASLHAQNPTSPAASRFTAAIANLLQSIGIASLLPVPGFLLLVIGSVAATLFLSTKSSNAKAHTTKPSSPQPASPQQAPQWRPAFFTHIGLCCAFASMLIFSITLIDRVADIIFVITALVSLAATFRPAANR